MDWKSIGELLARTLPAIRTKLMLSGFIVGIVAAVIVHFASPGNSVAMLSGGAIGISLVIFGQFFHFLGDFPARHRALVFLVAFGMFCILVSGMLVFTVLLLQKPTLDVTLGSGNGQIPRTQSLSLLHLGMVPVAYAQTSVAKQAMPLSKLFESDQDDGFLQEESARHGTETQYTMDERDGVLYVKASMPYFEKMRGTGYATPIGVDQFRWLPPVLAFKVNNPRAESLYITRIKIAARAIESNDEPILIIEDINYQKGPTSTMKDTANLNLYNVAWGQVRNPTVEFSVIRDAEVEQAAKGAFQHRIELNTFEENLDINIAGRIDPKMRRERMQRTASFWSDYLNVVGRLRYTTVSGKDRVVNFRTKVFFQIVNGGRINPSYKYNIWLPMEISRYPLNIPISQCVRGRSADNFLIAVNSPKSGTFDIEITLTSTGGDVLQKRIVLETLTSRNYGLARPKKIESFSTVEGCT